MATVLLQHLSGFYKDQQRTIYGPVTGNLYNVDQLGRVLVDTLDAPYFIARGVQYAVYGAGGGTTATSGIATLDFGSFPGSVSATVTVAATDPFDPNAEIDAWVIPVATADHTADEHIADPPRVQAAISGSTIVISGFASGRDLPVPNQTPFGNPALSSQMLIGSRQLTPYGKWSVAWAFSP